MSIFSNYMPYVDPADGLNRMMNNKKLYARLLKSYLASLDVSKITAPLESGDLEGAANAAHTLKGVSANLSIMQVFEKTKNLELILKAHQEYAVQLNEFLTSVEESKPMIEKLIAELETV